MKAVTAAHMRKLDRLAVQRYGIPILLLIDNAGRCVAEIVRDHLKSQTRRLVTILTGGGMNGGDGISAARYLRLWGYDVRVLWLKNPEEWEDDLAVHYRIAKRCGVSFEAFERIPGTHRVAFLQRSEVLIDALLGTGSHGPLKIPFFDAIAAMNASGRPIIAVDIPSGIHPDTGRVHDLAVRARVTVTMVAPKKGLLSATGRRYAGRLVIADIGMPTA